MSLEDLRAIQHTTVRWSERVNLFWCGFLSEIENIKNRVGNPAGITLHWRLPKEEIKHLDMTQKGLDWSFPPKSYKYDHGSYCALCKVEVVGLPRAIELQVVRFNLTSTSVENFALEVTTKKGVHRSNTNQLTIPIRMYSENPSFENFFFWSSSADNVKIQERLLQWLAGKSTHSEFSLNNLAEPKPLPSKKSQHVHPLETLAVAFVNMLFGIFIGLIAALLCNIFWDPSYAKIVFLLIFSLSIIGGILEGTSK